MNSREVEWGLLKSVTDIIADETAAISKTEASGGQPDSGQDRADMDIVGGPEVCVFAAGQSSLHSLTNDGCTGRLVAGEESQIW